MTVKRNDYISWDEYFMGVAMLSGQRSKDPSTQVGACIVSADNKVNHRLDARLYDRLGAFVARKQRHIQLAAFQAAPAVIQDRIEFTVSGIEVFIIVGILFSFAPWELVIGTALGKSVVAHGKDLVVRADDTGAHLCAGIL